MIVVVWAAPFGGLMGGSVDNQAANGITLTMPGESFHGPTPELDAAQAKVRDALQADVAKLAEQIGERNTHHYDKLMAAATFLEKALAVAKYAVERQKYEVKGKTCFNLIAELKGTRAPEQIVVVGAHYDSARGAPGANDNGSGVASLLALARAWADKKPERTLRFVLFANEEQPYFQTEAMGSLVYAKRCKERRENIVAMLALETMGYYSDRPDSQNYPFLLKTHYPTIGNFIGFVANSESTELVKRVVETFRQEARVPSEGTALPGSLQGVGWSDHWSFWQQGYPGVMVTDTALFRYPDYHKSTDTPDKLDYVRLTLVVDGLEKVLADLTAFHSPGSSPK
ncbi:MAG TPA: M28 family peptidase [Pirellulales bacterium]|jgi:hypothetical protein|nr:M28 family peptidase [Pirellulales bacterium]